MSAGTGVRHSEFNPSPDRPVHFFQIWIEPASEGTPPSYEQLAFKPEEKRNQFKRLAGPQGGSGAASINQDANLFVAELSNGTELRYALAPNRHAWVHAVRGAVTLNGVELKAGDAAAVSDEAKLSLKGAGSDPAEVLLFDLA